MALWSCTSSSNNSRDQSHGRKVKLPQCGSRKQTERKGKSDKASSGQSLGTIKVSITIRSLPKQNEQLIQEGVCLPCLGASLQKLDGLLSGIG